MKDITFCAHLSAEAQLELLKTKRERLLMTHDRLLMGVIVASQKIADLTRQIESSDMRAAA